MKMKAERADTDLVIRNQNRLEGQLEARHPSISPSYRDLTDLFHRERTRAISFEGDNETRRCEPLAHKNWDMSIHSMEPVNKEGMKDTY